MSLPLFLFPGHQPPVHTAETLAEVNSCVHSQRTRFAQFAIDRINREIASCNDMLVKYKTKRDQLWNALPRGNIPVLSNGNAKVSFNGGKVEAPVRMIRHIEPIPAASAFVTIRKNYKKEDDSKLRFVPYFGEADDLPVDHSIYDLDADDSDLDEEQEFVIDNVVAKLDSSPSVISALAEVMHLSIDKVKARIDDKRNKEAQNQRLKLAESGIDCPNDDMLLDTFEKLFCRRCYIYDCKEHGIQHPRLHNRRLPVDSLLNNNFGTFFDTMMHDLEKGKRTSKFGSESSANEFMAPADAKSDEKLLPCGANCFLDSEEFSNYSTEGVIPSEIGSSCLTDIDIALIRKLALMCSGNMCSVSRLLGKESCKNVWMIAMKNGIHDVRLTVDVQDTLESTDPSNPNKKRKHSNPSNSSLSKIGIRGVRNLKWSGEGAEAHHYIPCDHVGPCGDPAVCSCARNNTWCEKYCGCEQSCKMKFKGCACHGCKCQYRACPCFAANRECDPDLCKSCEAHLLPSEVKGERICKNVSLRYGLRKQLGISRSRVHGWGAFVREPVQKNEFVTEYVGELISQEEADRRGRVYDKLNRSYLFNLNVESVVDAARKGSKIKFANHSEAPNCAAKIIRVDGDHRIAIIAKRNLRANEEIFFDYHHKSTKDAVAPDWLRENHSENN